MRRDESVRCRNVGCSKLARCNALRGEEQATFEEVSHTYTIGGVVAQQSTTDLVAQVFEKFDAYATVSKYYNTWKTKKDIRYWDIIQSHVRDDGSIDDEKAMQTIIQNWTEDNFIKELDDAKPNFIVYSSNINWFKDRKNAPNADKYKSFLNLGIDSGSSLFSAPCRWCPGTASCAVRAGILNKGRLGRL